MTDDSDVHPNARESATSTSQNLMSPAFRQNQAIRFWQNFVARSGELVKGDREPAGARCAASGKNSSLTAPALSWIVRFLGQINEQTRWTTVKYVASQINGRCLPTSADRYFHTSVVSHKKTTIQLFDSVN
jgi:hypothetical protein